MARLGMGDEKRSYSPTTATPPRRGTFATKKDTNYRYAERVNTSCSTCEHYLGTDTCEIVAGGIRPTDVCDFWTASHRAPVAFDDLGPLTDDPDATPFPTTATKPVRAVLVATERKTTTMTPQDRAELRATIESLEAQLATLKKRYCTSPAVESFKESYAGVRRPTPNATAREAFTEAYAPSERVTRQPIRPTVTTTNRRDYSKPYENKALAAFRESYRRLHGGG